MPLAMINHIESEKVLPTSDLPKAPDVKSLGVVGENINIPFGYTIHAMAEHLHEQLYTKVMQRGIHPGHCAVIFDGDIKAKLFPPEDGGLPAFVKLVNDKLRGKPAKNHEGHMLQTSTKIEETLLYGTKESLTAASSEYNPFLAETSFGAEDTVEYHSETHPKVIQLKEALKTRLQV